MKPNAAAIQFMREILGEVGYEIKEDPHEPGWSWRNGTAECQAPLPTQNEATLSAWASASEYVRDTLGGHIQQKQWTKQWSAMSVGQQAKLILLCFDNENEETALADGLFQTIRENDLLKRTLNTLGCAIEGGDTQAAAATWRQAKTKHHISATH